ncbi:MAG: TlpA family protein disulfide reductase [Sphingobacteriaceae bacterium]
MKISSKTGKALLLLFTAGSLTLAGCTQNASKNAGQTKQNPAEGETQGQSTNSNVSFSDGDGKTVSMNDLKGKVVFINFWATWCGPCVQEMPTIHQLRQSFKDNKDVVFLMVDVDGKYKRSQAFMEENQYDLPVYIPNGQIPEEFLGNAIPTTVILSKKGEMMARLEGGRDYSDPEIANKLKEWAAME